MEPSTRSFTRLLAQSFLTRLHRTMFLLSSTLSSAAAAQLFSCTLRTYRKRFRFWNELCNSKLFRTSNKKLTQIALINMTALLFSLTSFLKLDYEALNKKE